MSDSNSNSNRDGAARKRNLPSWMSSREEENDNGEKSKQPKYHVKSKDQNILDVETKREENSASATSSRSPDFTKLMEGVVFVLSGFVNPERGTLRSQMLEMGAEYQPDWNSNCTLLVCAFANTPKFRQVEADGGTIISKDWISQCYNQRQLVDIEAYLLHAGKPWRRQSISHESIKDTKPVTSSKYSKQEKKGSHSKKTTASPKMKSLFSPSKVKNWAVEDFKRTMSWLESQDEKPDPGEINKIAAEGILTCLQDAIDAIKQGQGIGKIAEQWACVPRCVEELAQLDGEEDLYREAMACRQIYELEFLNMEHDLNKEKPQACGIEKEKYAARDDTCDSDATVEMTEEEIDQAYNAVVSTL